jgi:hypothetical protein
LHFTENFSLLHIAANKFQLVFSNETESWTEGKTWPAMESRRLLVEALGSSRKAMGLG